MTLGFEDLKPYQKEGVAFMTRPNTSGKISKLLNWEQGTGKTVITCVALTQLDAQRVLIVCPKNAKRQWFAHLRDWGVFKSDQIQILGSDAVKPGTKYATIVHFHELYNENIFALLCKLKYDAVVIDEVHKAKSVHADLTARIFSKNNSAKFPLIAVAPVQYLLSGTVMPNGPIELFPMLKRCCPDVIAGIKEKTVKHQDGTISITKYDLSTYEGFGMYFCGGFEINGDFDFKGSSHEDELSERLHKSDFFSRVLLSEVWEEMPEVNYSRLFYEVDLDGKSFENTHMSRLRIEIAKARLPEAEDLIRTWLEDHPGEKLLVFGYSVEVLSELKFRFRGYEAMTLNGKMSEDERIVSLDSFQYHKTCRVMFAQINCAGEAIDGIQRVCNTVFNLDETWTGAEQQQAFARVIRIGQTKPVFIYNVCSPNTMDDTMIGEQVVKQKRNDKILNVKTQEEIMPGIEETLAAILKVQEEQARYLVRIATSLEKGPMISVGNPTIENAKPPVDKPPTEKPKPVGKPTAKPAATTTAPDAAPTDTKPTTELSQADLINAVRAVLNRLTEGFTKAGQAPGDAGANSRKLIGDEMAKLQTADGKPLNDISKTQVKDYAALVELIKAIPDPVVEQQFDELGMPV